MLYREIITRFTEVLKSRLESGLLVSLFSITLIVRSFISLVTCNHFFSEHPVTIKYWLHYIKKHMHFKKSISKRISISRDSK